MPKTLNPQNTFPTSITNFPISGNDEPMTIEPLENAIQAVLNRSENLHVRLSEAETQGVKRVRTVASLAALSAATGFNNGDVCDVEGYGRYRLYNPSGLAADGLWVLNAAGGGRWVHTLRDMRGAGNGLATLDSSQRLAQDVRDASILTQHIANQAVTSAKLASGAAIANIGYTPVNKAGDTMSGNLVNTARMFVHRQAGATSPSISLAIGDEDTGLHWISDGVLAGYGNNSEAFRFSGAQFDFKVPFTGRYDHQNRFVVQKFVDSVNIPANSTVIIAFCQISIPSGKGLYLRRARWGLASILSPVVRELNSSNSWTGPTGDGDTGMNVYLGNSNPSNIRLEIVNTSTNTSITASALGIWAELEIR